MIIDGVSIAEDIYASLRKSIDESGIQPVLGIVVCNPNFETQRYLALKEKKAKEVGVGIDIRELDAHATTQDFIDTITSLSADTDGVILQLPVSKEIDLPFVLSSIPSEKDVDALNPKTTELLSPVVGAVEEILTRYRQTISGKRVVVVGQGRLVGGPASKWFKEQGADVAVVTKDDDDIALRMKSADIVLSGAGVPRLITQHMLKEGVVILDAGTSEDGGELRGDVDPACIEKASLFTPVPGGIGPITIAKLLQNVVHCAQNSVV